MGKGFDYLCDLGLSDWLTSSEVLWHAPEDNFTKNGQEIYPWYQFKNCLLNTTTASFMRQINLDRASCLLTRCQILCPARYFPAYSVWAQWQEKSCIIHLKMYCTLQIDNISIYLQCGSLFITGLSIFDGDSKWHVRILKVSLVILADMNDRKIYWSCLLNKHHSWYWRRRHFSN